MGRVGDDWTRGRPLIEASGTAVEATSCFFFNVLETRDCIMGPSRGARAGVFAPEVVPGVLPLCCRPGVRGCVGNEGVFEREGVLGTSSALTVVHVVSGLTGEPSLDVLGFIRPTTPFFGVKVVPNATRSEDSEKVDNDIDEEGLGIRLAFDGVVDCEGSRDAEVE